MTNHSSELNIAQIEASFYKFSLDMWHVYNYLALDANQTSYWVAVMDHISRFIITLLPDSLFFGTRTHVWVIQWGSLFFLRSNGGRDLLVNRYTRLLRPTPMKVPLHIQNNIGTYKWMNFREPTLENSLKLQEKGPSCYKNLLVPFIRIDPNRCQFIFLRHPKTILMIYLLIHP